jgi:tetratricopeptide (TPR) repeat protein
MLGRVVAFQGDYSSALALLHENITIAGEVGLVELIFNYILLGEVTYLQGDLPAARHWYETALSLDPQDRFDRGVALLGLGCVNRVEGHLGQATELIQESLHLFQTANQVWTQALALHALGQVAWAQGKMSAAQHYLCASLHGCGRLDDQRAIAQCLEGLAAISTAQDRGEDAVVLGSAAHALRVAAGAPLPPVERLDYEQALAAARNQLDQTTFAAAWAKGQTLSVEQAITYALAAHER